MENDMKSIHTILNNVDESSTWETRAAKRKQLINEYCWDEEAGMYFDYNYNTKQRRRYQFATTFIPLWAGVATPEQVRLNATILTSTGKTGSELLARVGKRWWNSHFYNSYRLSMGW
jgi:alpha,alpha-trehalase